MRFNHLTNGAQAEIHLNQIDYPSFDYIQLMIISLGFYPKTINVKKILIIGLGGGILPRAIRKIDPDCLITIIEIDPVVYEMAEKYFYFKVDTKMKVCISDGKMFLNNLSKDEYYDLIFVDAYDCFSSLPHNMKNDEFFYLLKNHLNSDGGLLIFNLVCIYQSYLIIKQRIASIFGFNHILTFRSNDLLNLIVIASTFQFPIEDSLNLDEKFTLIEEMKEKLSIDFHRLSNRRELLEQNSFIEISNDQMDNSEEEKNVSFKEFFQFCFLISIDIPYLTQLSCLWICSLDQNLLNKAIPFRENRPNFGGFEK